MVALCEEAYSDVAMELAISETNYTGWLRNHILLLKREGKPEPPVNTLQLRLRVSFTFYLQHSVLFTHRRNKRRGESGVRDVGDLPKKSPKR